MNTSNKCKHLWYLKNKHKLFREYSYCLYPAPPGYGSFLHKQKTREYAHRCLRFLRDSERVRPKDLVNQIKGKKEQLFLTDLFWPQCCGCLTPDTKLVCYAEPRLNKHYYQRAKLHSSTEKHTNRH